MKNVSNAQNKQAFHAYPVEKVVEILRTDINKGLTEQEVEERIKKYGLNIIEEEKVRFKALRMFLAQFKDVFVIMLVIATVLSLALEEIVDAITIGAIVFMVAVLGFVQEYRAEKALESLKQLTSPTARVLRNGHVLTIEAKYLTVGDIILLESGDKIPADARLIKVTELMTNEASLTGESTPVPKTVEPVEIDTPVADQHNMVFMGTYVVQGRGAAIVTATGMNTAFGKIAKMITEIEKEKTPLQEKLDNFATKLGKLIIALVVIIFVLGLLDYGFSPQAVLIVFMAAVALAISAVPEALPAVVTITLALGARDLAKKNAVIRRLASAETLGSVTYICADKTGTLTKGEMTVRRIYSNGQEIFLEDGVLKTADGKTISPDDDLQLKQTFIVGMLCNNTIVDSNKFIGEPTEIALMKSALSVGFKNDEVKEYYPRVREIPFSSERKMMTTLHKTEEVKHIAFTKGAPEIVLERCNYLFENGQIRELTEEDRKRILEINEKFASEGLRVLAMAFREVSDSELEAPSSEIESKLVFVGLQGMIDPPRPEAKEAIKICESAGIKNVMITGDHKLTATVIARELGLLKEDSIVLTGKELDAMSDEELEKIVEKVAVYARVSPAHKLRIVTALKKRGHVVAMTGDGVNDAPALKKADIGVAMGISGTDVTKDVADMVLMDDNYATLVTALMWGRRIYDNIRKYIRFLMACNFDELLVIGSTSLARLPLPMLPPQILWINLITDGAPAVALSVDPPDEDIIKRPPRDPKAGIFHGMLVFMIVSFLLQSFGSLTLFLYGYFILNNYDVAVTMTFVQAAMFELFVVWNVRSEKHSVWKMGRKALENKFFVIGTILSMILTLALPYIPILNSAFHCVPLTPFQLALSVGIASLGAFVVLPVLWMNKKLWKYQ